MPAPPEPGGDGEAVASKEAKKPTAGRKRRSRGAKAARLGIEIFGGLLTALVLIVAVAAWRLSEGPIQTDFLTPYIQQALASSGGNTIEIGETFVVWDNESRDIVLHAADIVVRDPEGRRIASLPEVALELSSSAMLQGTMAPNEVEIIAPRIRLIRTADGQISFGGEGGTVRIPGDPDGSLEGLMDSAAGDETFGNDEAVALGGIIRELLSERTPGNPLSFLDEVRIRNGQILVRDELLGFAWAAPAADISLRRDVVGLAGDISLAFAGRRDPATLDAAFLFDKRSGVVDLAAGFSDIDLASLGAKLPQLAIVGGVTSRISGSVATSISVDGSVGQTRFEIRGLAGTLAIPGMEMEPIPVRDLTMTGRYDDTENRFDLDEARALLGTDEVPGPILTLSGVFDYEPQTGGDWIIDTSASLQDVDMAKLEGYWPVSMAPNPRPWILENVSGGKVQLATATAQVLISDGDFAAAELAALSGTIAFSDVVAHYLRPLPPVENLSGTAEFDHSAIRFSVDSGSLKSIAIADSKLVIDGLDTVDMERGIYEQLKINAKVAGPVSDVLTVLEHPRLDLLSKIGLKAEGSAGTFTADLTYQFPLILDLTLGDLQLQNKAVVKDARLKDALLGQDVTEAQLVVDVDQNGMALTGPLRLGGTPLTIQYRESFVDNPTYRRVIEAEVPSIDDSERARFGLDIGDVIDGPLQAKVSMVTLDNGASTLQVATDLSRTVIDIPEIHWQKPQGTPGSLSMTIDMDDLRAVAYRDIILQAGDLVARGEALPGPDGEGMGWMRFDRIAFGRSDLQDVIVEQSGEGFTAEIGNGILDAEPFLSKDDNEPAPLADADAVEAAETTAAAPRTFEPLSIRAPNLERLYFAEHRRLERVNLELVRNRAGWETIRLSGTIPEQYWSPREAEKSAPETADTETETAPTADDEAALPEPSAVLDRRYLQFSLAPDASGVGQRLLAASDDLGALLRAVNIVDTVVGGTIQVTGSSDGPMPTHPLKAKVAARDFTMVKAPVLAKLLTVASFTGVLDLLSGEGIGFEGLDGEFILDDGVATTELMRVYGASLGFTAKGNIDFNEDEIDLVGTVVPAYSINNFLSKIPLLGTLLTGGEGQGLIAMVYGVKGEVDDPEVSVNPLSALTPGFLRNIFLADPGEDEEFSAVPERIDR